MPSESFCELVVVEVTRSSLRLNAPVQDNRFHERERVSFRLCLGRCGPGQSESHVDKFGFVRAPELGPNNHGPHAQASGCRSQTCIVVPAVIPAQNISLICSARILPMRFPAGDRPLFATGMSPFDVDPEDERVTIAVDLASSDRPGTPVAVQPNSELNASVVKLHASRRAAAPRNE